MIGRPIVRPKACYIDDRGVGRIELTRGHETLVSATDFWWIMRTSWHASVRVSGHIYAVRFRTPSGAKRNTSQYLHRVITGALEGQEVDHINSDTLDNRRENLRLGTHRTNVHNQRKTRGSSQFKGVVWDKVNHKWRAQIGAGVQRRLGRFASEVEAAKAYDDAARATFGEFAKLNFPRSGEQGCCHWPEKALPDDVF